MPYDYMRGANAPAIAAREAEKASAAPCPAGRMEIEGEIVDNKLVYSCLKCLIKTSEGWTCWGTQPGGKKGDTVKFVATLKPSDSDKTHGFFSRPKLIHIILGR